MLALFEVFLIHIERAKQWTIIKPNKICPLKKIFLHFFRFPRTFLYIGAKCLRARTSWRVNVMMFEFLLTENQSCISYENKKPYRRRTWG